MKKCGFSFANKTKFMEKIDSLPRPPDWFLKTIGMDGDIVDEHGNVSHADFELWMRDPVECVRELLGNPAFKDQLVYEASRVWEDDSETSPLYGEMWTGDWWCDTQVSLICLISQ
jgi:hypothetical protein